MASLLISGFDRSILVRGDQDTLVWKKYCGEGSSECRPGMRRCTMRRFPESKPCMDCTGTMDRRHGTLPAERGKYKDLGCIPNARIGPVGTYYRCLKNGEHNLIVQRDAKLPAPARRQS